MTRQVSTPRSGMWWVIKRIKESKDVGLEGRGRASKKQERLCKQNDHDHYRADYGAVSWARRASKSEACPQKSQCPLRKGECGRRVLAFLAYVDRLFPVKRRSRNSKELRFCHCFNTRFSMEGEMRALKQYYGC